MVHSSILINLFSYSSGVSELILTNSAEKNVRFSKPRNKVDLCFREEKTWNFSSTKKFKNPKSKEIFIENHKKTVFCNFGGPKNFCVILPKEIFLKSFRFFIKSPKESQNFIFPKTKAFFEKNKLLFDPQHLLKLFQDDFEQKNFFFPITKMS